MGKSKLVGGGGGGGDDGGVCGIVDVLFFDVVDGGGVPGDGSGADSR